MGITVQQTGRGEMNKIDLDHHNKLLAMELEVMKISKEYEICKDFYIALTEAAAALNWAQLQLRKIK
jgi:hypothetical protein